MVRIKTIIYGIFVPQIVQFQGKDLKLGNLLTIPKRFSGELGMFIDLMFYGYIFVAITSWFFPYIALPYRGGFYFIMILCLYTGTTFIPLLFNFYSQIRNDRKT